MPLLPPSAKRSRVEEDTTSEATEQATPETAMHADPSVGVPGVAPTASAGTTRGDSVTMSYSSAGDTTTGAGSSHQYAAFGNATTGPPIPMVSAAFASRRRARDERLGVKLDPHREPIEKTLEIIKSAVELFTAGDYDVHRVGLRTSVVPLRPVIALLHITSTESGFGRWLSEYETSEVTPWGGWEPVYRWNIKTPNGVALDKAVRVATERAKMERKKSIAELFDEEEDYGGLDFEDYKTALKFAKLWKAERTREWPGIIHTPGRGLCREFGYGIEGTQSSVGDQMKTERSGEIRAPISDPIHYLPWNEHLGFSWSDYDCMRENFRVFLFSEWNSAENATDLHGRSSWLPPRVEYIVDFGFCVVPVGKELTLEDVGDFYDLCQGRSVNREPSAYLHDYTAYVDIFLGANACEVTTKEEFVRIWQSFKQSFNGQEAPAFEHLRKVFQSFLASQYLRWLLEKERYTVGPRSLHPEEGSDGGAGYVENERDDDFFYLLTVDYDAPGQGGAATFQEHVDGFRARRHDEDGEAPPPRPGRFNICLR